MHHFADKKLDFVFTDVADTLASCTACAAQCEVESHLSGPILALSLLVATLCNLAFLAASMYLCQVLFCQVLFTLILLCDSSLLWVKCVHI